MRLKTGYRITAVFTCVLFPLISTSPVSRSSRMVREVYPEVEQDAPIPVIEAGSQAKVCIVGDVVYGVGESVPSEQPCLKCTCNAPEVNCETVTCHQQPGCKAIHRPNKCCPDYQCECHHEGKTYANGERLPSAPGNECHVCYCRGGEVQCAEVGCYTRDDCEPSHVPGQCCPKYDHCPPREPLSDRIQYTTEPSSVSKTEQDLPTVWTITGAPEIYNSTLVFSLTDKQIDSDEGSGDDSSSAESSSTANSVSFVTNEVKLDVSTPVTFSIKEIESKKKQETKIPINAKIDKATQTDGRPKITIQEVIPQRTEYQITSAPKDTTTVKTAIKIIEDSSNELTDSQSYASEKTEVYDHPPPVLRIGDQLLFFKQGQLVPEKDASTPSPVITLIGAEGLQIGVGSEEIVEHELLPSNTEEPIIIPNAKKTEDGLQDITINSSEDKSNEKDAKNTSTPGDRVSSEEFVIKEITDNLGNAESPKHTTINTLETVDIPVTQSPAKKSFKPIKRDHGAILHNLNTSGIEILNTPLLEESTPRTTESSEDKHSDSAEFIPEENPYYPPLPDIIEQEEIEEDHHIIETTTSSSETTSAEASTNSSEIEVFTTEIHSSDPKPKEKTLKELKTDVKSGEIQADQPVSESSESNSKEDDVDTKKETTTKSKEESTSKSEEMQRDKSDSGSNESNSKEVTDVENKTTAINVSKEKIQVEEKHKHKSSESLESASNEDHHHHHKETLDLTSTTEASTEKTTMKTDEMQGDQPVSESSSESNSKEDITVPKKRILLNSASKEHSTEEAHKKELVLEDHEVSSSEEHSSEELKDEPAKEENPSTQHNAESKEKEEKTKILPEILSEVINHTISHSTEKSTEWLKTEESSKKSAPLMNEKAALPPSVLKMTAPSDSETEEPLLDKKAIIAESVENITETTTKNHDKNEHTTSKETSTEDTTTENSKEADDDIETKKPKAPLTDHKQEVETIDVSDEKIPEKVKKSEIVAKDTVTKIMTELEKSKETLEISDESESRETTTSKNDHTSSLMANDDASVEVIKDSSQMDTSELVETVPGFESTTVKTTPSSFEEDNASEENLPNHPKSQVETIILDTQMASKEREETKMDEKHKREVVKKVLKDNFENPKENIKTELSESPTNKEAADQGVSEETSTDNSEATTEKFDPEVKIEDDFGDNPTKNMGGKHNNSEPMMGDEPRKVEVPKETEVIQRVGDVAKFRESTENLDTSLIGIFRDFFSKSQLRYANDAGENV